MSARAALVAAAFAGIASVAAAATHTVTIEGMKFTPASLTVKQGDTVEWKNKDVVPHTATAPGRFDSKNIPPGKGWSWKADAKGRIDYGCSYHDSMTGVVVVE